MSSSQDTSITDLEARISELESLCHMESRLYKDARSNEEQRLAFSSWEKQACEAVQNLQQQSYAHLLTQEVAAAKVSNRLEPENNAKCLGDKFSGMLPSSGSKSAVVDHSSSTATGPAKGSQRSQAGNGPQALSQDRGDQPNALGKLAFLFDSPNDAQQSQLIRPAGKQFRWNRTSLNGSPSQDDAGICPNRQVQLASSSSPREGRKAERDVELSCSPSTMVARWASRSVSPDSKPRVAWEAMPPPAERRPPQAAATMQSEWPLPWGPPPAFESLPSANSPPRLGRPRELSQQLLVCPQSHTLERFTTSEAGYTCEGCSGVQLSGWTMFGCRACNYDLCTSCARQRRNEAASTRKVR